MVQSIQGWRCPYCNTFYDKEYKAKDCANDCVEVDSPVVDSKFECEMCNSKYEDYTEAEKCESTHKEFDDKYYKNYLVKKNFEELARAGNHPAQKKLLEEDYDEKENKNKSSKKKGKA